MNDSTAMTVSEIQTPPERTGAGDIGARVKEWISKMHDELLATLGDLKTEIANTEHLLELKKLEAHTSIDGYVGAAQAAVATIADIRARLAGVHKAIGEQS